MATQEIIEETLDAIEETLDILEKQTPRSKYMVVGGTVLISFLAGALVGHLITKRRLAKRYSEQAEREIEEAKEYYAAFNKTGKYSDPTVLAEKHGESSVDEIDELKRLVQPYLTGERLEIARATLEEVTGRNVDVIDPNDPEAFTTHDKPELFESDESEEPEQTGGLMTNVFAMPEPEDPNFDYQTELKKRTDDTPYVISYDEFTTNESGYQQLSFSYYEGDDILADENDKPVEDADGTVGEFNLQRFGHGSKDNNVVYVRNVELELEFEIVRSNGKYVEQVLGFIQHSDHRRPRRFRSDDE